MSNPISQLDQQLIATHEAGDGDRLAALYLQASQLKRGQGDFEAGWFLLTQAYIFALEAGLPLADEIRTELIAAGREAE